MRTRTLFVGTIATCAAIATTNCGDGDLSPDGGVRPEGGTSGGTTAGTSGSTSAGSSGGTTSGDSGLDGDAATGADGGDAGDGGDADAGDGYTPPTTVRSLEWTVTSTGFDVKHALGSTYVSATSVFKPAICATAPQAAERTDPFPVSSYGNTISGSEFQDSQLNTQYSPFPGRPWIATYKTVVTRPTGGARYLRSVAMVGDQYYLVPPDTRTAETDCGDQLVASYQAERVFSVVASVWPDDPRDVMPVIGLAGVFDPANRTAIQNGLIAADAHIALHVLDGTAHQTAIEDILKASTCTTANLSACKATYDSLLTFSAAPALETDDNFATLPGVDWPLAEPGFRATPP